MLQRIDKKLYAIVDPEITDYIAPNVLVELTPKAWQELSRHMDWKVNTEKSGICVPKGFEPASL